MRSTRFMQFRRRGAGAASRASAAFRTSTIVLAALLAALPLAAALAQDAPKTIQEQMTPAQFKATGLDQLSAQQLANLNAWLNREIDTQTAQAVETVKQQVERTRGQEQEDDRGLIDFGSREPVIAHIQGAFHGFNKGRTYRLDNGQVWEQIDNASLAGVELVNPKVEINPPLFGNSWYLKVEDYNTRAKVKRVK